VAMPQYESRQKEQLNTAPVINSFILFKMSRIMSGKCGEFLKFWEQGTRKLWRQLS